MEAPTSVANTILFAALLGAASVGVSWVAIFLWRLYGAPGRLYAAAQKKISDLEATLSAVSQGRPFSYDHIEFSTVPNKKTKSIDVGATVYFVNHGDQMIQWRLLEGFIEVNGKQSHSTSQMPYFANKGQRAWFHYFPCKQAPFSGWPIIVDVMFDLEYDNVPPMQKRGSKRVIRFTIGALRQQNVPATDVFSEER